MKVVVCLLTTFVLFPLFALKQWHQWCGLQYSQLLNIDTNHLWRFLKIHTNITTENIRINLIWTPWVHYIFFPELYGRTFFLLMLITLQDHDLWNNNSMWSCNVKSEIFNYKMCAVHLNSVGMSKMVTLKHYLWVVSTKASTVLC